MRLELDLWDVRIGLVDAVRVVIQVPGLIRSWRRGKGYIVSRWLGLLGLGGM